MQQKNGSCEAAPAPASCQMASGGEQAWEWEWEGAGRHDTLRSAWELQMQAGRKHSAAAPKLGTQSQRAPS